ncbi:unnamed protein product [Durusdinium trenchii]|uniref:Altered inheritance of mitochondria protein 24, mitochondrial n=1 Tax=Durusdinium trenchii TaxID=1381693 RepID=A0ABP0T0R1_9DINO
MAWLQQVSARLTGRSGPEEETSKRPSTSGVPALERLGLGFLRPASAAEDEDPHLPPTDTVRSGAAVDGEAEASPPLPAPPAPPAAAVAFGSGLESVSSLLGFRRAEDPGPLKTDTARSEKAPPTSASLGLESFSSLLAFSKEPEKSPDAFLADKASPEPQPLPSSAFGSLGLDRVGTLLAFGSTLDEDPTTRPPAGSSDVSPEPKQAPGSAFGSLGLDRVSSLLPFSSPPAAEEDPAKRHPVGAASPEPQTMPGSAFGSLGLDHVSSLLAFSAPSAQEDPTTRPPAESSGVSPEPKQAPGSAFGSLGLDRVSSLLPFSSPPAAEEDPAKRHSVGAASPEPQTMPGSAFGSLGLDHVSSLLAFSAPSAQEDPTTRPPAGSSGVSPEPKQAPGSAFGSLGLDRVSSLLPLSSPPAAEEDPAKSHPVGAASPEPQAMPGSAFGSLGLDHVSSLLAFSAPSVQEDPRKKAAGPSASPEPQPPGSAFGSLGLDVSSLLAFGSTPAEEVPPPRHTPPHASRPPEEPPEAFASLFEHDPLQEEELDEVPTAAKPHLIRRDLQNEEEQPLEERATALPGELVEHEVAHEDEEQVPEPYLLELSSHGMVSQWAPFSSYLGSDLKLTAPLASPPGPLFALPPDSAKRMPEGFIALSVQHHESVSDATAISVGRYFYFDAADYPSFEFTSYPCTCELWRHGRLHWTGQVQLSLGSYGAVDLEDLACAAGRRAPASESRPGDFEVGDLIFVIGFHRNWAVSVGEHTPFEENLRGYQRMLRVGKSGAANRDELGDLGLRIHLDTEVDEAELAKVRPVEKVLEPAGPLDQRLGAANLSRENSLALAGLDEVAEETLENRDGDAGPAVAAVRSSFAWAARRKELLSGGLKSVQNRWEILNL